MIPRRTLVSDDMRGPGADPYRSELKCSRQVSLKQDICGTRYQRLYISALETSSRRGWPMCLIINEKEYLVLLKNHDVLFIGGSLPGNMESFFPKSK